MATRPSLFSLTTLLTAMTACAGGGDAPAGDGVYDGGFEDESSGGTGGTYDGTDGGYASESADGTSSDGGGSSGDGTDTGGQGGTTCDQGGYRIQVESGTPRVMLVLDKSNSMNTTWDHDGDASTDPVSRWNSLHHTVSYILDEFAGEVEFGAQLFPAADAYLDEPTNAFSCRVAGHPEVTVGGMTEQAILQELPSPTDATGGGTPAVAGLTNALMHLVDMPQEDPKAVILVTDGAANCSPAFPADETLFVYDDRLPELVRSAHADRSIPTYVVGVNILDEMGTKPAVNPYESLSEVAQAGGAARAGDEPFYNTFNENELADALSEVVSKIECTVELPDEPEYPEHVGIEVGGQSWEQVEDCTEGDGWRYSSAEGSFSSIELCGAACDALADSGIVSVDYSCPGG